MIHLSLLSKDELEAIHTATLRILSEVGISLAHPGALEVLTGSGATLHGDLVRLPADLVEASIRLCPKLVRIRGRSGEIILGDGNLHWHNLGGARDVMDPLTGERRPATIQDVRDSTRLLDALENVSSVVPLFTPQDVPSPLMSLAMFRHTLPYTTKPIQGPGLLNAAEVRYIAQMASVLGPPEEFLTLSVSPISPLTFPDDIVAAMMEIARLGIPFGALPCPIAGASAPMSLAGALAQQNAEVLASIVLTQRIHPGLPIIYYGRFSTMEPRTGLSTWGGVEVGMASAATVQMAHSYGLPVNVYGFCTDSPWLGFQNGFERALNAALPALAGADELSGIGEMAAGVSSSYAQMVSDNEIASSIQRIKRGITLGEHALPLELIAEVMRGSRQYFDQWHTVHYLRQGEIHIPRLAERGPWEEADRLGQDGFIGQAQREAERLLAEHEVVPLSEDQERELDAIMRGAKRDLLGAQ